MIGGFVFSYLFMVDILETASAHDYLRRHKPQYLLIPVCDGSRAERVPISVVESSGSDPSRILMLAVPNLERCREEGAAIRGNYL